MTAIAAPSLWREVYTTHEGWLTQKSRYWGEGITVSTLAGPNQLIIARTDEGYVGLPKSWILS